MRRNKKSQNKKRRMAKRRSTSGNKKSSRSKGSSEARSSACKRGRLNVRKLRCTTCQNEFRICVSRKPLGLELGLFSKTTGFGSTVNSFVNSLDTNGKTGWRCVRSRKKEKELVALFFLLDE